MNTGSALSVVGAVSWILLEVVLTLVHIQGRFGYVIPNGSEGKPPIPQDCVQPTTRRNKHKLSPSYRHTVSANTICCEKLFLYLSLPSSC